MVRYCYSVRPNICISYMQAWTNWPILCRRHIKIHFLKEIVANLIHISLKFVQDGPGGYMSSVLQWMTWCGTVAEQLSKPMLIKFYGFIPINGLMHKRRNAIANGLKLRLFVLSHRYGAMGVTMSPWDYACSLSFDRCWCEDLCARGTGWWRYKGQGQVITSHNICRMLSLVPALATCFWPTNPQIKQDTR